MADQHLTPEQRESFILPEDEQDDYWQLFVSCALSRKGSAHAKHQKVIDAIWADLQHQADIFVERIEDPQKCPRRYLRMKSSGEIIPLTAGEALQSMWLSYGLLVPDKLTDKVERYVYLKARTKGTPVAVCSSFHFDRSTFTLHVALDSKHILRMTPKTVDVIANGDGGLLFPSTGQKLNVDIDAIRASKLGLKIEPGSLMYETFKATYADNPMPAELLHQLVCSTILHMFFPLSKANKPALVFDAEAGAGKTWLADAIGVTVQGAGFAVSKLPRKEDDLEALLTSKTLVVLDNMDNPAQARKYTDLFCVAVSGGDVPRRVLFTTNDNANFPITANLIMTSVDLSWVRDTFADRALIIPLLPRIKDGTPTDESDHHQELLDGRDALMAEMLGRCRNILIAQQEQDSYKAPHVLRMHDFTAFVMRAAVHEAWPETALQMLRGIARAQKDEAESNNPILTAVEMLLGSTADFREPTSPTALAKRLADAAQSAGINLRFEVGEFGTGGVINKQFSALEAKYGLKRRRTDPGHPYKYWFEPESDVLLGCRSFAKQVAPFAYQPQIHELEDY